LEHLDTESACVTGSWKGLGGSPNSIAIEADADEATQPFLKTIRNSEGLLNGLIVPQRDRAEVRGGSGTDIL